MIPTLCFGGPQIGNFDSQISCLWLKMLSIPNIRPFQLLLWKVFLFILKIGQDMLVKSTQNDKRFSIWKDISQNDLLQQNEANKWSEQKFKKTMTLSKTCIMYLKLPEIFFCFVFENLFDLRITKVRANKIKMIIVLYNHKIRSDIV